MTAQIKVERNGHIAKLTISHPPANTWTIESLHQFKNQATELSQDREIYALVVTGEGEKFFSAGADLNNFASGDKTQAAEMAYAFGAAFEALSAFNGVSIAAINGYAMGGGLEAALACDIRIAEEHAQMALPEASVGLLPCAGGTQNLTALVGEGWAKRMILCGERVTAVQAQSIGLVEEVVDTGKSLDAAMRLAKRVAGQSPQSVSRCKTLIQSRRNQTHAAGLLLERELFLQLFDTQDQKEGTNAFLQKRKPNWSNS